MISPLYGHSNRMLFDSVAQLGVGGPSSPISAQSEKQGSNLENFGIRPDLETLIKVERERERERKF